MNNDRNMSLDEIMEKKPRVPTSGGPISLDVTKGKINDIPNNDANISQSYMRANVIDSGPVNMDNMTPVNINDILPRREKENPIEASLYAELDAAVERECKSITERIDAITEAQREEYEKKMEEEDIHEQEAEDNFALNGSYDQDESLSNNTKDDIEEVDYNDDKSATNNDANILDSLNDDNLFDEEDDADSNDEEVDNMLESLKEEVKKKITPIRKVLDLSKFSIAQKSVSAQKVMKLAVQSHQNIADWVLFSAERPLSVSGLSGPEILKLNPENSNRNRLNTFRDMYRIIYDHVVDANKPEFETWLKQLRFSDLQHVYFALYMATFGGSNFVNYACPNCNNVFLKDIKFEDMVSYDSEEVRNKVRNILKMDTTTYSEDTYPVDLAQISNSYVFGLRSPSVWNVIIETASLSDKFLEKHADLIDIVSYIDAIYIIDEENMNLIPVDTKPDKNDQAKTSARRIKAFYEIIRTLSSEDYYNLRAKINAYDEGATKIKYQIPSCVCPKCNKEIAANNEITPDNMLFTRHQLAAIGNM